jgi:hypothetical protein
VLTWCCAIALALLGTAIVAPQAAVAGASSEAATARIEARSADLLAVGLVHGDRMTIHLSHLIDNAPVRDAQVTLVLRGAAHPTTAETDGSYTLQTKDLALPGAAAVEFQVAQAQSRESLKGTLQIAADAGPSDNKNSARQLWWWVLNFAVCIGFLWLYSRRRKAADDRQ